jgi:hypothetical protein
LVNIVASRTATGMAVTEVTLPDIPGDIKAKWVRHSVMNGTLGTEGAAKGRYVDFLDRRAGYDFLPSVRSTNGTREIRRQDRCRGGTVN